MKLCKLSVWLSLCLFGWTLRLAAEPAVVNVYNWSAYISPQTLTRFQQQTGIHVNYDVYDSNEVLEAKLLAGHSGYDVVFPTARPFAQRQVAGGLYRALDFTQLPQRKNLDPAILADLATIDPGNHHLIPYMWGTTGIAINVAKVRTALGMEPPASWALLFDPRYAGKLAACGIGLLDDQDEGLAAALFYLHRDPNSIQAEDLTAVRKLFAGIYRNIRYFNSTQYVDDLANGDLCVAQAYSGDAIQAQMRARQAGRGVEIRYLIPQEGAMRWIDTAAIPADAPHPQAALAFLDFLMRPAEVASLSNEIAYANANRAALPLLKPTIRDNPAIYPDAATLRRLATPAAFNPGQQRLRTQTWMRIKSGL